MTLAEAVASSQDVEMKEEAKTEAAAAAEGEQNIDADLEMAKQLEAEIAAEE